MPPSGETYLVPTQAGMSTIPMVTGARITTWRQGLSLTRAELAKRIGVTTRAVEMWESEDRAPWYLYAVLHYINCEHRDQL